MTRCPLTRQRLLHERPCLLGLVAAQGNIGPQQQRIYPIIAKGLGIIELRDRIVIIAHSIGKIARDIAQTRRILLGQLAGLEQVGQGDTLRLHVAALGRQFEPQPRRDIIFNVGHGRQRHDPRAGGGHVTRLQRGLRSGHIGTKRIGHGDDGTGSNLLFRERGCCHQQRRSRHNRQARKNTG